MQGENESCSSKDDQDYLQFIVFTLSEKLSFCQVAKLGNFLKNLAYQKSNTGLNFFKTHSFDWETIANIATECFQPCLLKKLQ